MICHPNDLCYILYYPGKKGRLCPVVFFLYIRKHCSDLLLTLKFIPIRKPRTRICFVFFNYYFVFIHDTKYYYFFFFNTIDTIFFFVEHFAKYTKKYKINSLHILNILFFIYFIFFVFLDVLCFFLSVSHVYSSPIY